MRFPLSARGIAAAILCVVCISGSARAEAPTLMGSFKSWYVYSVGADATRVCYALSSPTATLPKGARRDPIYVIISTWPGRNVHNEPSFVPGYPYKDGSTVQIRVGNDIFTAFTKTTGTAGGAWIQQGSDEVHLIEAMRHGISMVVTGTSRRGTKTTDTYSLAGIADALEAIAKACR